MPFRLQNTDDRSTGAMITGTNFLNCTTGLPQLTKFGLCAQESNVLVAYNPQSSGLGLYTSCGDTSLKVNGVYYSLVNPPVTVSSASMSTSFFVNMSQSTH